MKLLWGFIGLFQDSPTYGRDRANLMSGLTVGTAGLLLNAAVLIMVVPLMMDPNDPDIRAITENVEFGQLLSLILLGGAAGLATVLIPLRMITVFWGPRIGGYFDQIVLSGISPLRYVIGKATSQNLFLGLILFLLLPYLVLSLTLGGMDFQTFAAGLMLVWLYCMTLALVTLWASLYLNDMLAALTVIAGASFIGGLGFIPMPGQPFVVTPFPALIHPLYSSLPFLDGYVTIEFSRICLLCAAGMGSLSTVALFGIYIGPLYGIIRENSTFGEVVRPGDSKRRRWLRLRQHIQRPSEIAFFYENRGDAFRRHEGLIRWGLSFLGLLLLAGAARGTFLYLAIGFIAPRGGLGDWWPYEFHAFNLVIHGISTVLAVSLFSHARNTTYLKVPVAFGWRISVSAFDSICFIVFLLLSATAAIATPFLVEQYAPLSAGSTLFPKQLLVSRGQEVDYVRILVEGVSVLSISGLVVYALHRLICLQTWLRASAVVSSAALYFVFICLVPMIFAGIYFEFPEWRQVFAFGDWAPLVALSSPISTMGLIFKELGNDFPRDTTVPFYLLHGCLFVLFVLAIRRRGRHLRKDYLSNAAKGDQ